MALSGVALCQWSVLTLGRFFTERVAICRDHQVVTSGPYRFVRHPGYAGTLLTVLGLALTLRNWLSLLVLTAGFFVSQRAPHPGWKSASWSKTWGSPTGSLNGPDPALPHRTGV